MKSLGEQWVAWELEFLQTWEAWAVWQHASQRRRAAAAAVCLAGSCPCLPPLMLLPILHPPAVNEKRDHIPPVVSGAAATFPFDIAVAG